MITTTCLVLAVLYAAQNVARAPEVHPDRRVTFRLKSPNSAKVSLSLDGQPNLTLTKGGGGVWSVTTSPLEPDIYGYSFSVDDVATLDPENPVRQSNLIWQSNAVLVPGNPAENWEVQDVPRGQVHRHFYKSKVIGDHRDYFVYTPPGYSAKSAKLPVLYLLHGYSDMANGWTEVGKANVILDNLIAQKKVKPMIVVMTLGYGVPGFASPNSKAFGDRNLVNKNYSLFTEALLTEVIPAIENDYRASNKRENRAIAGLSMGGAESLLTGLGHLDKFGHIGAFSSGGLPVSDFSEPFPALDRAKTKNLKTFWMACGTEDGLIGFQRGFADWLQKKGVRVVTKETPGGHTWQLWRRNLAEFSAMIFQK